MMIVSDLPYVCRLCLGEREFRAGSWDSTAYHRSAIDCGDYELMLLLRDDITFEDVALGARCTWVHEGVCEKRS